MQSDRAGLILVSVLTYRRLDFLHQALSAIRQMKQPRGWRVQFLVIDNDAAGSAQEVAASHAEAFYGTLSYIKEPVPGIPAARNRALTTARDRGATLLCFIDDDEMPDADWLCEMVSCRNRTGAVLVGGPVRFAEPSSTASGWQRFVARSLIAMRTCHERQWAKRARSGLLVVIGTGSWLGDVNWISRQCLEFDQRFRDTGGEDLEFQLQVERRGGRTAWCERAIAYEHLPFDRLSVRNQFFKIWSLTIVSTRLRPQVPVLEQLARQSARLVVGAVLILMPFRGRASFMLGVHHIASACGKISALTKAKSRLYSRAAG